MLVTSLILLTPGKFQRVCTLHRMLFATHSTDVVSWCAHRQASVETLEVPSALSSNTLPDDDREAMAAQSQQEQGQV